ncbi:MAG: response regulator [Oscillospiraceae bacterium]|nr:response regulator [Oscillospiraceae bacterium]
MKKIPLMLVDDDSLMVNDLKTMVDWDALGFKIICSAANGKKALSLFQQHLPPLVITDISMPIMDGLDLTDHIMSVRPDTYVLILTSYDDFDFARRVLRSGAKDYILKNELTPATLTEKLTHIYSHMAFEDMETYQSKRALLREYFQVPKSRGLPKNLEVWNSRRLYYFILSPALPLSLPKDDTAISGTVSGLYHALKNMVTVTYRMPILFYFGNFVVMGIMPNQPMLNKEHYQKHLIRQMGFYLSDFMPESRAVFYCRKSRTLDEIRDDLHTLRPLLHFYTLLPSDTPLELDELKRQPVMRQPQAPPSLGLSGKSITPESLKKMLRDYLTPIINGRDAEGLISFHSNTCSYFESLCENRLSFGNNYFYRGLDEYLDFLADAYMSSLEALHLQSRAKYSMSVRNAMDFILRQCSNSNLTIEKVAENVGFSAGRLSVLFKTETGQTINKYLTDVRIDMAINLLENSNYKIYEIAEMVGYKSSQYFSQIFYQKTGRRPIDYRKIPD